jgi:hypothetical protein
MTNWILRGLVFGAAMTVVRLVQGTLINVWQTQAGLISIVLLLLFLAGAVAWGFIDGREDAASNPDPDRRGDLAMTWLLAGLIAGILSGLVTWLIGGMKWPLIGVIYKALYVGGLINELTTFAAFTALVVFLGAISGVTVGRWRIDRAGAYKPQGKGTAGSDVDRADTDVFAAVRSEQVAAEGAEWPQEQHTAVATAEREETTEPVSPAAGDEETKKIPWPPPAGPEQTHPAAKVDDEKS